MSGPGGRSRSTAAAVTLSTSALTAAPGQAVGCDVQVTNPAGEALTLDVGIDGGAAEWAVVLPPRLVLAAHGSGRARVTFTVPDGEHLAGSTRQFVVRVRGGVPVDLPGRIDVAEVHDLRISVHPLVARGRGTTSHTVTVENRGTGVARAGLVAHQEGGGLRLHVGDERVAVSPGATVTAEVTVAPARRLLTGRARPHRFTVEARPEFGPPVIAAATRFQEPVRWRRGALAAVVAVVAVVAAVAAAGGLALGGDRAPDGHRLAAMVPAPATSLALASACPTSDAGALRVDIAGFAYCPVDLTVGAGAEVVWANADLAPHTVTYEGPDGTVDSGSMAQGRSWSARFALAGTYRYYCRFHPGMSGTIVVVSSQ